MTENPHNPPAASKRTLPPPGDSARYVFCERARCPGCGSVRLKVYKTIGGDDDDSVTRYTRCKDCGQRFIIVAE